VLSRPAAYGGMGLARESVFMELKDEEFQEKFEKVAALETTLGQMAPPKSGHPLRMPPDAGGILRGFPLLGGAICPNVDSRAGARTHLAVGSVGSDWELFFSSSLLLTLKPRVE